MMTCRRKRIYSEKGFTLQELIVVMIIIGIVASIAFPSIISYTRYANARLAAREAVSLLRQAKSAAITTNTEQQVVFNNNQYGSVAGNQAYSSTFPLITNLTTMPSNISTNPVTTILFTPNGAATLFTGKTSTVNINNNTTLCYQVIVTYTGRISANGPLY